MIIKAKGQNTTFLIQISTQIVMLQFRTGDSLFSQTVYVMLLYIA